MTISDARPWTGRHLVDGAWRDGAVDAFENRNPARFAEVLGRYPRGSAADVEAVVAAARRAFVPWRRTSRIRRGELFDNLASLIKRDVDDLAAVISLECGKVFNEAKAEVIEGL